MTNDTNVTGAESSNVNGHLQDILFNVAIGVVGSLGILGNGIVCLVFLRVRTLRTTTNMFILNQSMIDFTSSLVFVWSYLGPTLDPVPLNTGGTLFCKLWLSLYPLWSLFDSSSLNLTAITLERYFAIVYPVLHHNQFKMTWVRIVMVTIWCVGFFIEGFWPYVHYNDNGICTNSFEDEHFERFVGVVVFVVEYAFPMTIFVYCYLKIFLVLRTRVREHNSNTFSSNQGGTYTKASRNVTKTLCVVVITYFLCWTVPSIAYFQNWVFGGPLNWNGPFYKFTVVSVFCNVCCNPLIYALMWDHFRKALKKTFNCATTNKTSPDQSQSLATITRA
ncbi:galanin receptor 2b-like [Glandiceps talaboti]